MLAVPMGTRGKLSQRHHKETGFYVKKLHKRSV